MQNNKGKVITIGNFDGVHLGHQALIEACITKAQSLNADSHLLTFAPHPVLFFTREPHYLILGQSTKTKILENLGLTQVQTLDFQRVSTLSARDFFHHVLLPLKPLAFVVGQNFAFGLNRTGDLALLKSLAQAHHMTCDSMALVQNNGTELSSSVIRSHIRNGEITKANALLGRHFALSGKVIKGAALARKLGFPTANVMPPDLVLPACGSYVSFATVDDVRYPAVSAVTRTPSLVEQGLRLETHILGELEHLNLYDKYMHIEFTDFIRGEEKFDSLDALQSAISQDIAFARVVHGL